MLVRLSIRDIVLIDQLELEFGAGLSILTGETGAGKSILLDSLALALGGRGDGAIVRQGAAQGQVTATFALPPGHGAASLLRSLELPVEDELILRRQQMADGRTRAFVNDQAVSAQTLRAVAAGLVEIHGQHDERALMDPAAHRSLVDAYGALEPQALKTRQAFERLRALEAELSSENARLAKAKAEADFAAHAHEELSRLDAQPGEEDALAERRAKMMQGEKVAADLREAYDGVGGDASALPSLVAISRRLHRRLGQAPDLIEPCVKALDEAMEALERATQALEGALRDCAFDPQELERCEERLFALRGLARKYGGSVEGLPALARKYAADLAALQAGEARAVELGRAIALGKAAYGDAAKALSGARQSSAKALDKAVNAELPPLKLERARFSVEIAVDAAAVAADGYDRIEFYVRTNPGSRAGPLMKVASGGELARFLLALKVSLAERGTAPSLVFDEIDTGVGGAVADAIGARLARLAAGAQVLAVTHAPQVAARATSHFKIAKGDVGKGERVATRVSLLDAASRREEIARMLAGAQITSAARAAAKSLIEAAGA